MGNLLIVLLVLLIGGALIYTLISLGVFGAAIAGRKKPGEADQEVSRGSTGDNPQPRRDSGTTER